MLRLLDGQDSAISLPRVLAQLASYPQLLHDRITEQECAADLAALAQAAENLKQVSEPHFAHHERTLSALAATHRAMDAAIDLMVSTVKTYYWIVADSYIDMDMQQAEDPMEIFSSAWAVPCWPSDDVMEGASRQQPGRIRNCRHKRLHGLLRNCLNDFEGA